MMRKNISDEHFCARMLLCGGLKVGLGLGWNGVQFNRARRRDALWPSLALEEKKK